MRLLSVSVDIRGPGPTGSLSVGSAMGEEVKDDGGGLDIVGKCRDPPWGLRTLQGCEWTSGIGRGKSRGLPRRPSAPYM